MEVIGREGRRAGHAEDMLGEHVERAVDQRRRILRAEIVGLERGAAFEHLEAVGRHQDRLGGLVHAVVGAADALGEAAGALRRADMDDEVDVTPVDAEIERGGGDDGAQGIRLHRLLDAAALADIERAMMERDGQVLLVDPPQFLEDELGLAARVDEDQRGAVAGDLVVELLRGIARRMAGPGHALARIQNGDLRLRAAFNDDHLGHGAGRILWHQPAAQLVGQGNRRGEPDHAQVRHVAAQAREAERQEVAPLGGDKRVQLVEHHEAQVGKEALRVARRDQQGELLGRGEQDIGRHEFLARPLVLRRVAGAGLHGDAEADLGDRLGKIALDIDGQRLQRRDVERVDAAARLTRSALGARRELDQGWKEAGQRLASAGGRDEQDRAAGLRLAKQFQLVGARRPAARGEPMKERFGQKGGLAGRRWRIEDRQATRTKAEHRARQGESRQELPRTSSAQIYGR